MRSLNRRRPTYATLSPMTDTYTSTIPLVSAVEIKRDGQRSEDAQLQLGTLQAASLAHIHSTFVREDGMLPIAPPQIGWTVIGHLWAMYITWRDTDDGSTVCLLSLRLSFLVC